MRAEHSDQGRAQEIIGDLTLIEKAALLNGSTRLIGSAFRTIRANAKTRAALRRTS